MGERIEIDWTIVKLIFYKEVRKRCINIKKIRKRQI